MLDVKTRLDNTPEIFVRLPGRRDGLTRYRLTTTSSTRTPEQTEALIKNLARRESWLFYAIVAMIFFAFLIAIMVMVPAI